MATEDAVRAFEDAVRSRGIIPPLGGIIADGIIKRCAVEGTPHKKDAAYILFPDHPMSGGFQNWRDGKGWENWTSGNSSGNGFRLTAEEVRAAKARQEKINQAREQERADRQKEAAAEARKIWEAAKPADPSHPYLTKKKIKPNGLRVDGKGNLLVPMRDSTGELWNLQRIDQQGEKRFMSGGRTEGIFFTVGPIPEEIVVIAEGASTGLSINEATDLPVIVAMSAGNLLAAGKAIREKLPKVRLIYFADNDHPKDGVNVGVSKATEAAKATGGIVAMSPTVGDDANDLFAREGAGAVKAVIDAAMGTGAEADTGVKPKRPLFDDVGRTLRTGGIPAPIWLVWGLIERGLVLLFGPSGSMKSFIAMYLAFCLVVGRDFFGRKVERGPAVYICGEGRSGAYRRFSALELHYGIKIPEGSLFLSRRAVTLDSAAVDPLREEIQAATAAAGRPPVLLVIDTLARSLVGDENSQKDMAEFVNAVDNISAEFGCTALIIHHTGHAEDSKNRARGSSVLPAAGDSIIRCDDRVLTWTKTKDAEPPEPVPFALKKISIGKDADGKEISSAVIVEAGEGTASRTSNIRLKSSAERLAMETLIRLSAKGELRADRYWVGLDEWRAEFVRFHCGDNKKSKQTAFGRIRGKLADLELVSVENDWYAVVRPEDIAQVQDLVTFGPLLEKVATLATSENDPATL
jgi:Uncharacterized protein conserved in bacteria